VRVIIDDVVECWCSVRVIRYSMCVSLRLHSSTTTAWPGSPTIGWPLDVAVKMPDLLTSIIISISHLTSWLQVCFSGSLPLEFAWLHRLGSTYHCPPLQDNSWLPLCFFYQLSDEWLCAALTILSFLTYFNLLFKTFYMSWHASYWLLWHWKLSYT